MASIKFGTTIKEFQNFVEVVYGLSNDRYFSVWDMVANMERFMMRGLKGIRKKDADKTKLNIIIAFSWFMSLMNQLHIDIENEAWKRFPYLCSYCGSCPCSCKDKKIVKRQKIFINENKKPKTLNDYQKMFNEIYPAEKRNLENAGVHMAEEAGEFSEAILTFRGGYKKEDFKNIELEAADFFSCLMSVFNSLNLSAAQEISSMFSDNCHVCKKSPCECNFKEITNFQS